MNADWKTIIETAFGSGAGAAVILWASICRDKKREIKKISTMQS